MSLSFTIQPKVKQTKRQLFEVITVDYYLINSDEPEEAGWHHANSSEVAVPLNATDAQVLERVVADWKIRKECYENDTDDSSYLMDDAVNLETESDENHSLAGMAWAEMESKIKEMD